MAQKELYGREVETYEDGFICYDPPYEDGSMYVQLLYVIPEKRQKGVAARILREIRDKYNVKYFSGYIDKTTSSYKVSLLAHIKAGYDIIGVNGNNVIVSIEANKL